MDFETVTAGVPDQKQAMPQKAMPQAAEVLASKGRKGDDEIAHVTTGEIVVPLPAQTPEVLSLLEQTFAGIGVPMAQYTVGSTTQNINPETGMPEYGIGKKIKKVVKKVAPIALTIAGAATGNPFLAAAGAGVGTKIGGGSWGDALLSAGTAGITSGLTGSFGKGLQFAGKAGPLTAAQMADPFYQAGLSFGNTSIGGVIGGALDLLPSTSSLTNSSLSKALVGGLLTSGGGSGGVKETKVQTPDISGVVSGESLQSDFNISTGQGSSGESGGEAGGGQQAATPSNFNAGGGGGILERARNPNLIREGSLTPGTTSLASTSDVAPWDQVKSAKVLKYNPGTGVQEFAAPDGMPNKRPVAFNEVVGGMGKPMKPKNVGTRPTRGRTMSVYQMPQSFDSIVAGNA